VNPATAPSRLPVVGKRGDSAVDRATENWKLSESGVQRAEKTTV